MRGSQTEILARNLEGVYFYRLDYTLNRKDFERKIKGHPKNKNVSTLKTTINSRFYRTCIPKVCHNKTTFSLGVLATRISAPEEVPS